MKWPIVADSTCLIGLERIGRLDLLRFMFDRIVISPEVGKEFGSSFAWLEVESPGNQLLVVSLRMLLDDGEAEAIALASEKGWRVILDDRHARLVAKDLGLTVMGTLGVLVKAKQEGIISGLRPLLDELEQSRFYISKALKDEALKLVGE